MTDSFDDDFTDEDYEYLGQHLSDLASTSTAMVPVRPAHAPELKELFDGAEDAAASITLPRGFDLRADGIHVAITKKNGEIEDLHVCGPLIVAASARTPDGKNWSKRIRFLNRDGKLCTLLVSEAELTAGGKSVARRLAAEGLFVGASNEAKKQLMLLLCAWNPRHRIFLADRLGWADDAHSAFILGSGQVIGDPGFQPAFEIPVEHQRASASKGSLAGWQRDVAALCVGNPLMIVAVSLALVGPLLQPLRIENFGLHLRGSSSSGKSTLQRLACSVWGSNDLKRSWNGTRAGIEAIAVRHNGTLLVLDELAEVSPADVEATIYGLGNGAGRARGTSTGGAQTTSTWRLPVLSSGEIGIAEHMARAGAKKQNGLEMRLLDIPADTQAYRAFTTLHGHANGATLARAIDLAVAGNHGTAGAAFVAFVASMTGGFVAEFTNFKERFEACVKAELDLCDDPLIERTLTKFAIIAYAGEIASITRVTGWSTGTAIAAAVEAFKLWLGNRQNATRAEIRTLLAPMRSFISTNGATGFADLADPNVGTATIRFGWRDPDAYYFTPTAFDAACDPHERQEVLDLLDRRGMLKKNNGTGKQWKMPARVPGRPPAYAVKREAFDELP